jgi:hypothetical protein
MSVESWAALSKEEGSVRTSSCHNNASGVFTSPARCALKVYLMKAYERDFLDLREIHFPTWFIERTMECVTTARFSISINGKLVASVVAGVKPLSPTLFVLAMEIFSCLIL